MRNSLKQILFRGGDGMCYIKKEKSGTDHPPTLVDPSRESPWIFKSPFCEKLSFNLCRGLRQIKLRFDGEHFKLIFQKASTWSLFSFIVDARNYVAGLRRLDARTNDLVNFKQNCTAIKRGYLLGANKSRHQFSSANKFATFTTPALCLYRRRAYCAALFAQYSALLLTPKVKYR